MAYLIKDPNTNQPAKFKGRTNIYGADYFAGRVELKDFNDRERSFWAVLSTNEKDRFGDVIEQKPNKKGRGWVLEPFRRNPSLMAFHEYNKIPIGRSLEEQIDRKNGVDRLLIHAQIAPFEETKRFYEAYRDGWLKGWSCGFLPLIQEDLKVEEKDDAPIRFHTPVHYLEQELLEGSATGIPANSSCLTEVKHMVQRGWLPRQCLGNHCVPSILDSLPDEIDLDIEDDDIDVTTARGRGQLKILVGLELYKVLKQAGWKPPSMEPDILEGLSVDEIREATREAVQKRLADPLGIKEELNRGD